VWTGDGWTRTRRQLGASGFIALFVAPIAFHIDLPIGLYGVVAALLGLGELVETLGSIRVGEETKK
jgi:hypothetical protein